MILTLKRIPRVTPKPESDEVFHRRMVDTLAYGGLSAAGVIFLAEVILAWPH